MSVIAQNHQGFHKITDFIVSLQHLSRWRKKVSVSFCPSFCPAMHSPQKQRS